MATILDSLMVELGLDSSKFMANQKKVIDALKEIQAENEKLSKSGNDLTEKTTAVNKKSADQDKKTHTEKKKAAVEDKKAGEESSKRAKQIQLDNKHTADSFDKIVVAAMGFTASVFGAKEIYKFSTDLSLANASLGRTATLLGQNPQELQAWGKVFEAGGDAAGAYSDNLGSLLSKISKVKVDASFLSELSSARINAPSFMDPYAKDPKKMLDIYALSDELKRLEKAENITYAQDAAQRLLNISSAEYLVLTQNSREELKKLLAVSLAKVAVDLDAINRAKETQEQITSLDQASLRMGNNIQETLGPQMKSFRNLLIDIADSFNNLDNKAQNLITNTGLGTIIGSIASIALIAFPVTRAYGAALAKFTLAATVASAAPPLLFGDKDTSKSGEFADIEKANGLPIGTLAKIRQRESRGDDSAVSRSAEGEVLAEGPFGIRPSTGAMLGLHDREAFDVGKSSNAAGKYLGDLLKKYHDMDKALAAYNWGPTNVDKKGMGNLPKETSDYISYMHQDNMTGSNINTPTSNTKTNNSSVQTGDIHIHTQATESAGIGESLSSHLGNLLTTGSWASGTN